MMPSNKKTSKTGERKILLQRVYDPEGASYEDILTKSIKRLIDAGLFRGADNGRLRRF